MCYYNGVKLQRSEYIRLKQLEKLVSKFDFLVNPMVSGFDYGLYPLLKRRDGEEDFDIVRMEWGFIPPYWKTREEVERNRKGYKDDKGIFHPPILTLNAVGEELLFPNKIFRNAALNRRCLVLSSGFYEWRHFLGINKRTGQPLKTAVKFPYHIRIPEQEYFFMAGIWQPWTDQQSGEYVESFAIVTTAANALMEQVHNSRKRMPVILPDELAWEWLLGDLEEKRITEIATFQFPAEKLEAFTISKDFRESPEPALPFDYKELPSIKVNF